jgi:hypothetical protein
MNDKIIYEGIEYKDKFMAWTTVRPSLRMRLGFLFCASFTFEHESYTKELMPSHRTIMHVHIRSLFDQLKAWYNMRRGRNRMQCTMTDFENGRER